MANTKKNLRDLTLLDRFLFAEAVEDPEIMQLILEVSPELVQLLHFMEHTNEAPPADGECEKVQRLRKKIEAIKSNEEVGVRFMQEWEERELERIDARKEGEKLGEQRGLKLGEQRGLKLGKQRGLMLGEQNKLRNLVQKKLAKNQSLEKIAEDLMEDLETIRDIAKNLSVK